MVGMRCAACGFSKLGAFPSVTIEGKPIDQYEKCALEVKSIPIPQYGENVFSVNKEVVLYACPNCGTLRIRLKAKE